MPRQSGGLRQGSRATFAERQPMQEKHARSQIPVVANKTIAEYVALGVRSDRSVVCVQITCYGAPSPQASRSRSPRNKAGICAVVQRLRLLSVTGSRQPPSSAGRGLWLPTDHMTWRRPCLTRGAGPCPRNYADVLRAGPGGPPMPASQYPSRAVEGHHAGRRAGEQLSARAGPPAPPSRRRGLRRG
jgi:hypothetical protein